MRDSRVGTYALVGVALLLQIKVAALTALPGER
jgi:cobalamin synthase